MPKVSIIIMTQNRLSLLKEAIETVFKQTLQDYELIVILGKDSIDNSLELLTNLKSQGHIRFCVNDGTRIDARNLAFELAQGEYVCFLDDDDQILKNRLEVQSKYLDEHPDVDVVSCTTMLAKNMGLLHTLKKLSYIDIIKFLEDNINIDEIVNFQSCMFRKSFIDKAYPDGKIFEPLFIAGGEGQFFLYDLILNKGAKVENTNDTVYVYQVGKVANSLTANVNAVFYKQYLFDKSWDEKKYFVKNFYQMFPKEVKPKKKRGRPKGSKNKNKRSI